MGGEFEGYSLPVFYSKLKQSFLSGTGVGDYFDLIAGTSTGGIIAMGLGFSIPCSKIVDLYKLDGNKIFPPKRFQQSNKWWSKYVHELWQPKYDHKPLERLLYKVFQDQTLGKSKVRLTIPSCMIPKSEIAVFKTDHHPDYIRDHKAMAWEVCRATSSAPTYFAGHERNGRMFIDGGLWANNPINVAVTEALSCFDIEPKQLRILSIGTGNKPFDISLREARRGLWNWKSAITGAMHLSTENAASQVALFIGDDKVVRIEPEHQISDIEMDDWCEAVKHTPDAAVVAFQEHRLAIAPFFKTVSVPRKKYCLK